MAPLGRPEHVSQVPEVCWLFNTQKCSCSSAWASLLDIGTAFLSLENWNFLWTRQSSLSLMIKVDNNLWLLQHWEGVVGRAQEDWNAGLRPGRGRYLAHSPSLKRLGTTITLAGLIWFTSASSKFRAHWLCRTTWGWCSAGHLGAVCRPWLIPWWCLSAEWKSAGQIQTRVRR